MMKFCALPQTCIKSASTPLARDPLQQVAFSPSFPALLPLGHNRNAPLSKGGRSPFSQRAGETNSILGPSLEVWTRIVSGREPCELLALSISRSQYNNKDSKDKYGRWRGLRALATASEVEMGSDEEMCEWNPKGQDGKKKAKMAKTITLKHPSAIPESFSPDDVVPVVKAYSAAHIPSTTTRTFPTNLSSCNSLEKLLELLAPFASTTPSQPISGADAVGAMNRLKRLSGRGRKLNDTTRKRVDGQLRVFAAHALVSMERMNGKLVGLAVNAVCGQGKSHQALMQAASRRAQELASSDCSHSLDVQAISMTLNSFAKNYIRDEKLFNSISRFIQSSAGNHTLDNQYNAQAVSVIVNAFAKLGFKDTKLFDLMSNIARTIPAQEYGAQAVANILNAFARHDLGDEKLFKYLSRAALAMNPSDFRSQHIAIILNAFAKVGIVDDTLFAFFAKETKRRSTADYDLQAIANIANAYAKTYGTEADSELFNYMSNVVQGMHPRAYDAQNVASVLNSFVKSNKTDKELFSHLSIVSQNLDPLLFDGQAVSNILHSFAKANIRDDKLFAAMADVALSMDYMLEAQSVALILNAFSKMELTNHALMTHLSRVARRMTPDSFDCQHVENIVNAYARLDVRDAELFRHMASVTIKMPPARLDAQAIAITLNAFARMMPHDVATYRMCDFFANSVLPHMPMTSFEPTSISIILNAFAKIEVRNISVFRFLGRVIRKMGVDSFDPHNIANMFHAYATLHIHDKHIVYQLTKRLLRFELEELAPEEVAVIAWSSAALNLKDQQLNDFLIKGLDVHIDSMEANFLRQAHQFLMSCELDGLMDIQCTAFDLDLVKVRSRATPLQVEDYLGKKLSACRTAFVTIGAESIKKSRLQGDVASILFDMGVDFEEEYVDDKSGYTLDLLINSRHSVHNKTIAIEVDGPSHYAAGSQIRLGRTVMKHRHLEQLGFDLRSLPYWEWDNLQTPQEKVEYLTKLLKPAFISTLTSTPGDVTFGR